MTVDLSGQLTVNEIFYSIQGESYLAGLPCAFIRLTGCHQRCSYCDTEYSFYEGERMTIGGIMDDVARFPTRNALITGGEPLLQELCPELARAMIGRGYRVSVETGGNRDVSVLPREAVKIMDLKTPGSGEYGRNRYENLSFLDAKDEIKFVVTDEADADWALAQTRERKLQELCHVSVSPTDRALLPRLAESILKSGLPVRLQTQFHKVIWPERERGF